MREIKIIDGTIEADVSGNDFVKNIQHLMDMIRDEFRKDSKSVRSIFAKSIEFAGGKLNMQYRAEIYDYDFEADNSFWKEYRKALN
jgi:hypothetical protein